MQTRVEIRHRLALDDARVSFPVSTGRTSLHHRRQTRLPGSSCLRFISETHPGEPGIVYWLSRKKVDETAAWLKAQAWPALPYHAGMDAVTPRPSGAFQRDEDVVDGRHDRVRHGHRQADVRFVAHLDLPRASKATTGRPARGPDGTARRCMMTYGLGDVVQQRRMIDQSEAARNTARIVCQTEALLGLCENRRCRRVRLSIISARQPSLWQLRYLPGAAADLGRHGGRAKSLSCIFRTGQRFRFAPSDRRVARSGHRPGRAMASPGPERLRASVPTSTKRLGGVFRQLVTLGFVRPDYAAFGRATPD